MNLVQNAIDHTPADARITLCVRTVGNAVELLRYAQLHRLF